MTVGAGLHPTSGRRCALLDSHVEATVAGSLPTDEMRSLIGIR